MRSRSIRVGILGCGRLAEHHLRFVAENPRAELAGLSDTDLARARSLAERYHVPHVFSSLTQMLESGTIDVLHVVTPPALHYQHACYAIDKGIHVFIEKPVAFSVDEVKDLYTRAAQKKVKICPDFLQLFHPIVEKISDLLADGQFGSVIHVESFMAVESALPELKEWPGTHWSFELPGGVLHNYITHPLYLTLNWIGRARNISVRSRSYGLLPQGLTDHLDVMIEGEKANANITLSFAVSQGPYAVKLYCEKGSLSANFDTMSLVVNPNSRLPRSARRLLQNVRDAGQLMGTTFKTLLGVLTGRVVPYAGMRALLNRFYASIGSDTPPPVPEDLVLNTAEAEEFITRNSGKVHLRLNRPATIAGTGLFSRPRVLVTGASGFVGKAVVRKLVDQGYHVRAYVRPLSDTRALDAMGAEVVHGDVRDRESFRTAAQNMESIVHLAAGVKGSRQFAYSSCVQGAQNLADVARDCAIKRVLYVSSMAIYDFLSLRDGQCIREDSPLEPDHTLRSTYAHAKRAAEDVALSHINDREPGWTIVRPSLIFGPGWNPVTAVGVKVGRFVFCLGGREKLLRLIHIDDVCEALVMLMNSPEAKGKILNLSHPEAPELRQMNQYIKQQDPRARIINLPGRLLIAAGGLGEVVLRAIGRQPVINRRRMAYLVRSNYVDGTLLRSLAIWTPAGKICEQLSRAVGANPLAAQPLPMPITNFGAHDSPRGS